MLYPKNQEIKLNPELFKNPTKEYRGTLGRTQCMEKYRDILGIRIPA